MQVPMSEDLQRARHMVADVESQIAEVQKENARLHREVSRIAARLVVLRLKHDEAVKLLRRMRELMRTDASSYTLLQDVDAYLKAQPAPIERPSGGDGG